MRAAEVRSGQLVVKQGEKPTRWITVQGKKIPITPKKPEVAAQKPAVRRPPERGRLTGFVPEAAEVNTEVKNFLERENALDLLIENEPLYVLPDGSRVPYDEEAFSYHASFANWLYDELDTVKERVPKPDHDYSGIMEYLLNLGWVRVNSYGQGEAVYEIAGLDQKRAAIIDDLIDEFPSVPSEIYLDVWPLTGKAEHHKLTRDDYEQAGFSILSAVQQKRRLPESMRRFASIWGGQLIVKQKEKPTRWITVQGKRIPITPKKERAARLREPKAAEVEPAELAIDSLIDAVYKERPLGEQEPERPSIHQYNTRQALNSAGQYFGFISGHSPSGWYVPFSHEIHAVSPEYLAETYPDKSAEDIQSYWKHIVAHETMHSTGLGRNLRNCCLTWGEPLNEIATRRFLLQNDPEMRGWLTKAGPYQREIDALTEIAYVAAHSQVQYAGELLGELLSAAEKDDSVLSAEVGQLYKDCVERWGFQAVNGLRPLDEYSDISVLGSAILRSDEALWSWSSVAEDKTGGLTIDETIAVVLGSVSEE